MSMETLNITVLETTCHQKDTAVVKNIIIFTTLALSECSYS